MMNPTISLILGIYVSALVTSIVVPAAYTAFAFAGSEIATTEFWTTLFDGMFKTSVVNFFFISFFLIPLFSLLARVPHWKNDLTITLSGVIPALLIGFIVLSPLSNEAYPVVATFDGFIPAKLYSETIYGIESYYFGVLLSGVYGGLLAQFFYQRVYRKVEQNSQ